MHHRRYLMRAQRLHQPRAIVQIARGSARGAVAPRNKPADRPFWAALAASRKLGRTTGGTALMRIAMIGTGYGGLVSGACFSECGVPVVCVDQDAGKSARLERG